MLSRPPDSPSGATRLRDCPALQVSYLSTPDRGAGQFHLSAKAGSPYKADVLRRLELTKDMVRKALPRLSATAEIETIEGKHTVVDPLFAEWIERINQGLPDPDTLDDAAVETTEASG